MKQCLGCTKVQSDGAMVLCPYDGELPPNNLPADRLDSRGFDLHPIIGQFRELKFPLFERLGFLPGVPQTRLAFDDRASYADGLDCSLLAISRRSV